MKEEPDLAQSRSGVCTINLKLKTRSKLHSAEVVSGGSYGTETAVLRTNIGKGETLVIGCIEHLCPYLELLSSRILNSLESEKSTLRIPSPRRLEKSRGASPGMLSPGKEKQF